MRLSKNMRSTMVTFSSVALLAACGNNGNGDTLGTTPVQPDKTEEVGTTEDSVQESETNETDAETGNEGNDLQSDETSDVSNSETSSESVNQDSPGIETIEFPVNVSDAIEIFNNEFGSPNIDEIEFEREDGRYIYEFEGWDGEFEYEMEIC